MTQYRVKYNDGTVGIWRDHKSLAILDHVKSKYLINEGTIEMRGYDAGREVLQESD